MLSPWLQSQEFDPPPTLPPGRKDCLYDLGEAGQSQNTYRRRKWETNSEYLQLGNPENNHHKVLRHYSIEYQHVIKYAIYTSNWVVQEQKIIIEGIKN